MRNFMSKFKRNEAKECIEQLKDIFSAPNILHARQKRDELVKALETNKPVVARLLENVDGRTKGKSRLFVKLLLTA